MTGTRSTEERLRARIAQLEVENTQLRTGAELTTTADAAEPARPVRRRGLSRSRWWTAVATVLVVLGALLAPVGLIANWAEHQLSDTDTFVATFAPLADKPEVQALITAETTSAIDDRLQIKQLTANLVDGLSSLDLGPRAKAALRALEAPAAQGIENIIHSGVAKFVSSSQFAALWTQLLRTSHTQMIKTMQGSPSAAVTIANDGAIGIQLGPVISAVKQQLVRQGIAFAANIPVVSKTIVIARSDSATLVQSVYLLANSLGSWLPWASLLFLAAGVAVARRRSVALVWAGVALTLSMILTGAGLGVGRLVVIRVLADLIPRNAAIVVYNQIIAFIADTVLAIGVLAFAVAVVGWFAGPSVPAVTMRNAAEAVMVRLRGTGDRYHLSTGGVGRWLGRQAVVIRVLIALAAAAVILFTRPITVSLVIWTAVVALLLLFILELVVRKPSDAPSAPSQVQVSDS